MRDQVGFLKGGLEGGVLVKWTRETAPEPVKKSWLGSWHKNNAQGQAANVSLDRDEDGGSAGSAG